MSRSLSRLTLAATGFRVAQVRSSCTARVGLVADSETPNRGLDADRSSWEFPTVHTLIVDAKKRIRLPDARPNQVFAYERHGEGQFLLTRLIKEEAAESFPRGSLKKYLTRAKAREELALLKGCSLEVPE